MVPRTRSDQIPLSVQRDVDKVPTSKVPKKKKKIGGVFHPVDEEKVDGNSKKPCSVNDRKLRLL